MSLLRRMIGRAGQPQIASAMPKAQLPRMASETPLQPMADDEAPAEMAPEPEDAAPMHRIDRAVEEPAEDQPADEAQPLARHETPMPAAPLMQRSETEPEPQEDAAQPLRRTDAPVEDEVAEPARLTRTPAPEAEQQEDLEDAAAPLRREAIPPALHRESEPTEDDTPQASMMHRTATDKERAPAELTNEPQEPEVMALHRDMGVQAPSEISAPASAPSPAPFQQLQPAEQFGTDNAPPIEAQSPVPDIFAPAAEDPGAQDAAKAVNQTEPAAPAPKTIIEQIDVVISEPTTPAPSSVPNPLAELSALARRRYLGGV